MPVDNRSQQGESGGIPGAPKDGYYSGGTPASRPTFPWQASNAKVIETDADGKPTKYTIEGQNDESGNPIEYYTPDSTMYKLGFRDSTEYTGAANRSAMGVHEGEYLPKDTVLITDELGAPVQRLRLNEVQALPPESIFAQEMRRGRYRIPITDYRNRQVLLTPDDVSQLEKLDNKGQFDFMLDKGIIEKGSAYVETDGKWSYKSPTEIQRQILELQAKSKKATFEKNNVKLDNGDYVPKTSYDRLNQEQKKYLKENGVQSFNDKYVKKPIIPAVTVEKKNIIAPDTKVGSMTVAEITAVLGREPTESELTAIKGFALPSLPDSAMTTEEITLALGHKPSQNELAAIREFKIPNPVPAIVTAIAVLDDYKNRGIEAIRNYKSKPMTEAELKLALGRKPTAEELRAIREFENLNPLDSLKAAASVFTDYVSKGIDAVRNKEMTDAEIERALGHKPTQNELNTIRDLSVQDPSVIASITARALSGIGDTLASGTNRALKALSEVNRDITSKTMTDAEIERALGHKPTQSEMRAIREFGKGNNEALIGAGVALLQKAKEYGEGALERVKSVDTTGLGTMSDVEIEKALGRKPTKTETEFIKGFEEPPEPAGVPPLVDYVDSYFQEKKWLGGSNPSTEITMAKNSQKLMDEWNYHFNEARNEYIKEYGQNRFVKEIFATLPSRTLTLFPSLALVPIGGSLLAMSVPLAKGKYGAKGWAGVEVGEALTGVLGLIALKAQVTGIGEKLAEQSITSQWQRLAYTSPSAKYIAPSGKAFKTGIMSENQKQLDDAFKQALRDNTRYADKTYVPKSRKLLSIKNIKVFGESETGEPMRYIFTNEQGGDNYLVQATKTSLKGGVEDRVTFARNPRVGAELSFGASDKNFNYGDLNSPLFVDTKMGTGIGSASAVEINVASLTPENAARLMGLEQMATYYNAPLVVNVPELGGAFIIPPLPSKQKQPKKSEVLSPDKMVSIANIGKISPAGDQSVQSIQIPKGMNLTSSAVATSTKTGTLTSHAVQTQASTSTATAVSATTATSPSTALTGLLGETPVPPPDEEKPEEEQPDGKIFGQPPRFEIADKIPEDIRKKLMRPGGKITWKQGFIFWTFSYPYKTQKDLRPSRTPPKGAYVVKGAGSAYKTIQLLTGEYPKDLPSLAMGAFKITFQQPKQAHQKAIQFSRLKKGERTDLTLKGVREK